MCLASADHNLLEQRQPITTCKATRAAQSVAYSCSLQAAGSQRSGNASTNNCWPVPVSALVSAFHLLCHVEVSVVRLLCIASLPALVRTQVHGEYAHCISTGSCTMYYTLPSPLPRPYPSPFTRTLLPYQLYTSCAHRNGLETSSNTRTKTRNNPCDNSRGDR